MKKTTVLLMIVSIFAFMGGIAFAQIQGLPANPAPVKTAGWSGDVEVRADKAGAVTIGVPIASEQKGAQVTLFRSYAKVSNDNWQQVVDGKYELATKSSENQAAADLALGNGIFRVRVWGKAGITWLFINPASKFCRKDAKQQIAYEFIVKTDTGEVMPVPENYPAWD